MVYEIELGTITYTDITIVALAVDKSALTAEGPHQVIQANDAALFVLFDAVAVKEAADAELERGLAPDAIQRNLLEIADLAARQYVTGSS